MRSSDAHRLCGGGKGTVVRRRKELWPLEQLHQGVYGLEARPISRLARARAGAGAGAGAVTVVVTVVVALSLLAPSPALAGRSVTITGGGWGHGIGMSQYGAYWRAKQGAGPGQILKHYYTGTDITPAPMPHRLRVGLLPAYGSALTSISFGSSARKAASSGGVAVKVTGSHRALATGSSGDHWRIEASPTGGMRVYKNDHKVKVGGSTVFGGPRRPVYVVYQKHGSLVHLDQKNNDYAYGRMKIETYPTSTCSTGYCERLVLKIPMEKYVYGLGEVPSSWPQAALQTQAIAGRTYAFRKVTSSGQHRYPCDCAVYDSTIDQAYIGDAKRTGSGAYWAAWKHAVDATAGKVITYHGAPIDALYSSSSGGHTENNENVWGGSPVPYLRGVSDKADKAGGANPNFKWSTTMSWADLSSRLNSYFGDGTLQRFKLEQPFGVSGRVTVVKSPDRGGAKIVGSTRTVRASGWAVRAALGLKDTLFRVSVSYTVAASLKPQYERLSGAPGHATGPAHAVPRHTGRRLGKAQGFEVGRMTHNRAAGKTVWQHGHVLHRYNILGREKGVLGMPLSSVWGPGAYKGATYDNGIILASRATGAHSIRGKFLAAYRRAGGPKGKLELPLLDRHDSAALPGGGELQRFGQGTIYHQPRAAKAHALWGPIDERYRKLGMAGSACGYPLSSIAKTSTGAAATFQHGTMSRTQSRHVEVRCS